MKSKAKVVLLIFSYLLACITTILAIVLTRN